MEFKDYYQLMGVARDATAEDIKKAYRRLARKYHPDVSKEASAEVRFKEMREAYDVLRDPEKRAAYDQLGANWKQGQDFTPPQGWDAGFEGRGGAADADQSEAHSDFFEALFRRAAAGPRRDSAAAGLHLRGEDRHARIQIDLEDAYIGVTRNISLRIPQIDSDGRLVTRERQIEFVVPKGIRAGQHIRLAGQGGPGSGQGAAGDLYLEVGFRPHALYRVDVRDVYLDLPVAPWEAALGAALEVPTPAGVVELTVPPGSAAGRKLRVRGRGIPGTTPGDFYFVLKVVLPPVDGDDARAAYTNMAAQFRSFRPRAVLGAHT